MSTQNNYFSVVREFKAEKQKVFNAFSTAAALGKWWGPVDSTTSVLSFEFKTNGKFHYKLTGERGTMWGRFIYQNIIEPNLIEFISSFADEKGDIDKDPFGIGFPLEIYNKLTFEETNGITTVTLHAYPINATKEQEAVFYSISENMQEGYGGTFNKLKEYLATL